MPRMRPPHIKSPLVLRQPPPPFRPHNKGGSPSTHLNTLSKIKEEYTTENCSIRTRPFYLRGCKRKILLTTTTIVSLPDELMFDILLRVPTQDIYNAIRLVCKKWYKIIHTNDFIHAHLNQSQSGFLTQGFYLHLYFFASGNGLTTEISKLHYTFTYRLLSSCNGLVLELERKNILFITNPITRQNFAVPPSFENALPLGHVIAYAATSMEYKVVCAFEKPDNDEYVAILTVGVDKDWTRRVNTRHLSRDAMGLFLSQRPFTTQGFVHWAQNDSGSKYVLSLNVETEVITQFVLPPSLHPHDGENEFIDYYYYYLPMGNYLSLLIARSKFSFSWEFWEMKPETGEWAKLPNIDLEAQVRSHPDFDLEDTEENCTFTPGGWLKFREVLVFRISNETSSPSRTPFFMSCNVRTGEFHEFELNDGAQHFVAHRNSLVWMGKS